MTTTRDEANTVPPVTDDAASESHQPGSRRRQVTWLALAAVVVAAGAGAGVWLWVGEASTEVPAAPGPVATAVVELGTLSATESWDGTLDHGAPFTVASGGEGVITRLAGQGETVTRGDELFGLNEQPVTLLYGTVPMFRNLGPGDSGADVEQLQKNLAELGYDDLTVDGEYGTATAEAVEAWQADIGADPTGMVPRSAVIFKPERGQVDALRSAVGDVVMPGTPVLDITGTDEVVSLEVDVDDRAFFEVDTEVTVVLPGGEEITGTVAATAIVEIASASGPGGETDTESVVEVEITLGDEAPDEFVDAPVEVVVAVDERTDVLLVPVNALLALAEGGYGLEVVADGGTTSIVPVQTGLFADGRVEIEVNSAEITEGTVVGTAGR
jgi:peptidoglycan hydrolase-like protein with peptidoglycan-binding domain